VRTLSLLPSVALSLILSTFGLAQNQSSASITGRIPGPIDDRVRITLKGNVHPLAQARYDQGVVADSFPVERMFLLLQRSPDREAALTQFLQDAHRTGSASYHKWLTPEQFGELYGPDDTEIAAVSGWLQQHGFSIARVTKGKTAIEFSGTAGQLRETFHTEIHSYLVNGEQHHANNLSPQIPAALQSVVAGITPINDFHPTPYVKVRGKAVYDRSTHKLVPQWTFPSGLDLLDLDPGDFAIQYDLNPLYSAGTTGKGVTIGIIGASNVDPTVVATYRTFFGLAANTFNVVIDGSDPGQNDAVVESYLDVEQSGAVAPEATINLYTSAGTSVQDGLYLAAQRAIDDDVASVLSTSYGTCEQNLGTSGNQFWAGLWEQAAAQGQTAMVSSGDGGPAGCDNFDAVRIAQYGIAVNGFASTPWNVAVGGTDFYYSNYSGSSTEQQTQIETYWDTVPTLFPTTSLLKPVPEQPWNDPFGLNLYSDGIYNPNTSTIVGGSGGPSNCSTGVDATDGTYSSCTSGYAKPAWQSGSGVPTDGVRDLPDVSLFAAAGENDTSYPICTASYECVISDGDLTISVVGGTSASSPAMAGILALVNQKYGRQGQANFVLYPLAAQHEAAFHDVTVGSNVVPCLQGSPDCTLSTANDNTKTYYTLGGFYAGKGYDLATGLGSVDANVLVQNWNSLTFKSSSTTLGLSQTTFTHGTRVSANVGVSGSGGTPTGSVALETNATPQSNTSLSALTLASGSVTATFNNLPGGQYQVTARYGGDSIFGSSTSTPVTVNVSAEASTLSLSGKYYDYNTASFQPLVNGGSYPYGTYIVFDAQPRGANVAPGSLDGIPSGTLTFADTASAGNTNSGSLALDRSGTAEWIPTSGFASGTHSLNASYSGDPSFNPSTSTSIGFSITKILPAINMESFYSAVGLGQVVTLTADVGVTAFAGPPTGTVTFYNGNAALGAVPVGPPPYYNPSVAAASLNVTTLAFGTNTVTARYNGDTNFDAVTSSAISVVVSEPAGITASVNPPSGTLAQTYVITANVAGVSGQPAPTGAVEFYINGGSTWSGSGSVVNGVATFTFDGSTFFPGVVNASVSYSGDTVYAPSGINVPINMTPPFNMSATPIAIASPGATTNNTSAITITPATGFTGSVYFQCTLEYYPPGSQLHPTCSVPASINVTGASPVAATMTINSTGPTNAAKNELRTRPIWLAAQIGAAIGAFVLVGIPTRRRNRVRMLGLLIVVALIVGLPSCGGGSMNSGGGKNVPQTTPGSYTFMLEGGFTPQFGFSYPQIVMVQVTIQ